MQTKAVTGLVYESLSHAPIQQGITITIRPMGKAATEPTAKTFPLEIPGQGAGVKFHGPR
jgi:hypothetical protein